LRERCGLPGSGRPTAREREGRSERANSITHDRKYAPKPKTPRRKTEALSSARLTATSCSRR
jgi:hypothetical protein